MRAIEMIGTGVAPLVREQLERTHADRYSGLRCYI